MQIHIATRKQWRDWLRKNHKKEKKVSLILHKKHTKKPSISHKESMEEAICFGWIDTTLKRIDEDTYQRTFARRTDKSKWSKNTLRYAQELIKKKKMCKEGLRRYNQAKNIPPLDHYLPDNPEPTEEMEQMLKHHLKKFNKLPKSTKKMYIYMFLRSKRPETKEKRIQEIKAKLASRST